MNTANTDDKDKNIHANHRKRLDEKVAVGGLECLSAHEQLEYILFDTVRRGDTNALAHRLLERFGDLRGVFSATMEELMKVHGVGREVARSLSVQYDRMRIAERSLLAPVREYKTNKDICDYAFTWLHGRPNEMCILISLSGSNRIIKTEILSEGTIDHVSVYVRNVVKCALDNYASSVVIAHNHPSGILRPSQDDIMVTKNIISALKPLEIGFRDHIIVSGGGCYSFYEHGDI